ncbi:MAG: hypothetical protein N3A01_08035 [Bacteroidales bacterium]|nr:hypothetical protein [Bacteroidales bacterium]
MKTIKLKYYDIYGNEKETIVKKEKIRRFFTIDACDVLGLFLICEDEFYLVPNKVYKQDNVLTIECDVFDSFNKPLKQNITYWMKKVEELRNKFINFI